MLVKLGYSGMQFAKSMPVLLFKDLNTLRWQEQSPNSFQKRTGGEFVFHVNAAHISGDCNVFSSHT